MGQKVSGEATVKDIRCQTRRQHSTEKKIRIVLEELRREETSAELCRREGIAQSLYYKWNKEFLEAGKSRMVSPTLNRLLRTCRHGSSVWQSRSFRQMGTGNQLDQA